VAVTAVTVEVDVDGTKHEQALDMRAGGYDVPAVTHLGGLAVEEVARSTSETWVTPSVTVAPVTIGVVVTVSVT